MEQDKEEQLQKLGVTLARVLPTEELGSGLPTPLERANLPTWSYNHLMRSGIKTVELLLEMSKKKFLRVPNLGKGSLEQTQRALYEGGFTASLDAWPAK